LTGKFICLLESQMRWSSFDMQTNRPGIEGAATKLLAGSLFLSVCLFGPDPLRRHAIRSVQAGPGGSGGGGTTVRTQGPPIANPKPVFVGDPALGTEPIGTGTGIKDPNKPVNVSAGCGSRLCGEQRWNFEPRLPPRDLNNGDSQGWTDISGERSRPLARTDRLTARTNVYLRRVIAGGSTALPPGYGHLASLQSLQGIGGDYWDIPYHTGYEGNFWLGSAENRPYFRLPADRVAGDVATINAVSPEFSLGGLLPPGYVHFLASGGCGPGVKVVLEQRIYRRRVAAGCQEEERALASRRAAIPLCRERVGRPGWRC
jgi:hypothetical protein